MIVVAEESDLTIDGNVLVIMKCTSNDGVEQAHEDEHFIR
jgi:hypothetical protein